MKSVIVIPSTSNAKRGASTGNDSKISKSDHPREKCSKEETDLRAADDGRGDERCQSSKQGSSSSTTHSKSVSSDKNEERKKLDPKAAKDSTLANFSVTVTSIDGITKLSWPGNAVKHTSTTPSLSFSCNPSFYPHNLSLSKEEERRRTDLFIISDVLDDIIDYIDHSQKGRKSKKHKHMKDKSQAKANKKKKHRERRDTAKSEVADGPSTLKDAMQTQTANLKKKRKSKKKQKTPKIISQNSQETDGRPAEAISKGSIKPVEDSVVKRSLSPASIVNGENVKIEKQVKRLKRLKKKVMTASADGVPAPSPVKKAKLQGNIAKEGTVGASDESSQQKITIAFNQNSGKLTTAKSKWDTSSDEEGGSRKGAISYRFSEESDTEQPVKTKTQKSALPKSDHVAPKPFGKMQPGGMLKTIEMHNPLPDLKPSVPIAHPNPGPDGHPGKSKSRSRTRSRSKTRSRSRSYSYSSDDSYYRSRKGRKRSRRHRRSYSRSYTRSRSRSYSTSRSRSRSYSRSYSRSTSRSHSRYRSYSRSSYSSYSSRSYSSRSRSRSPRYTRAVQPKYNNTRAYNLGKRKKFKKKNQFKNQQNTQNHQNPNIQKQLETGRAKAEETVMRLKKQKEEQQDLQKRAMASIAAAASSAGIPLPKSTTPPTATVTSISSSSPQASNTETSTSNGAVNGATNDLIGSFEEASQRAAAPAFVPRSFQKGEFIGPVRPGMDSDIPLPEGTPTNTFSRENQQLKSQEPEPMAAPDQTDEAYRDLQEQAMQHVQGSTTSPTTEQLQQQLAVTHYPMPDGTTFIDPTTGQAIQLAPAFPTAQAVHQHQLVMAAQAQQLQMQQAQSPTTPDGGGETTEDGKPAPHEAVIKSYAHQIFMSQQKALVSQSQPTFAVASSTSSVPQAGLPIQSAPVMVTGAQAAQLQLQAQMQQIQQAQAQAVHAQAQAAAQAQAIHAQQIQQLQLASLGLPPQALAVPPNIQQALAQQQLMQQAQAQAAAQAGLAQQQLVRLPNGQIVVAAANPAAIAAHPMMLAGYHRPL